LSKTASQSDFTYWHESDQAGSSEIYAAVFHMDYRLAELETPPGTMESLGGVASRGLRFQNLRGITGDAGSNYRRLMFSESTRRAASTVNPISYPTKTGVHFQLPKLQLNTAR
jgi:hypothetical protein